MIKMNLTKNQTKDISDDESKNCKVKNESLNHKRTRNLKKIIRIKKPSLIRSVVLKYDKKPLKIGNDDSSKKKNILIRLNSINIEEEKKKYNNILKGKKIEKGRKNKNNSCNNSNIVLNDIKKKYNNLQNKLNDIFDDIYNKKKILNRKNENKEKDNYNNNNSTSLEKKFNFFYLTADKDLHPKDKNISQPKIKKRFVENCDSKRQNLKYIKIPKSSNIMYNIRYPGFKKEKSETKVNFQNYTSYGNKISTESLMPLLYMKKTYYMYGSKAVTIKSVFSNSQKKNKFLKNSKKSTIIDNYLNILRKNSNFLNISLSKNQIISNKSKIYSVDRLRNYNGRNALFLQNNLFNNSLYHINYNNSNSGISFPYIN